MAEVELRSAEVGEEQRLLDLWRAAGAEPAHGEDLASLARLLAHESTDVVLAEIEGVVVGSLIAAWDGWRGEMYRLAVLPDRRRQGIARRLVDEGERRLRDRGCTRVTALVMHEHEWAMGLWDAVGYAVDDRIVRFVHTLE